MSIGKLLKNVRAMSFKKLLLISLALAVPVIVIAAVTSGPSAKARAEMAEASRPAPPTPAQLAQDALNARRREYVAKKMAPVYAAKMKLEAATTAFVKDPRFSEDLKMAAAKDAVAKIKEMDELEEQIEKEALDTVR